MISRYTVKEIEKIWTDNNKLENWLLVEISVIKAWEKLKIIPNDDVKKIIKNAKVNHKKMLEIEKETKHDVVAFTRMISESLGSERRWIHLGLTSTDVVDTAQNILIRESNLVLLNSLKNLKNVLKQQALRYKETIITGRTHGIYGEPTSLGLKFLLWYSEIERQIKRLEFARTEIEVAKISGSMGNYASLEVEVEEYVAKDLNLNLDSLSTQVTQRDKHAFLISVFANISSTLEKIAVEIRSFQRSEVQELMEGFELGQKGSSSMPHKKNPISSENICGLARYIRSFTNMAYENNVLWHERDISHSSNERIMFPDIYNTLVYSINRMKTTIENIVVNETNIKKHIKEQNNIFFSQRLLTHILINTTSSREEVYDFIQECTLETQRLNKDFKVVLLDRGVERFIETIKLEELFNINYFLRNVDKIFRRII